MSSTIYNPLSQNSPANESVQTSSTLEIEQVDTRCGFWMWKPAFLQPLARIGCFTFCFSFASVMTQTLTFYVNSQMTTLERQFGFSSRQTGIILAANDIGYLVSVLLVAYAANRIHIPRSLGVATVIYGIAGVACSLPHFLFGASITNDPATEYINSTDSNFSKQSAVTGSLCDLFNNSRDPCAIVAAQRVTQRAKEAGQDKVAEISLVIIVIGMAVQGFGKAPRLSFSLLYVDDNTTRVRTGFYAGIMLSAGVSGPVLAFLLGGVFSRMYVTLEATTLTPRHPKWIGAWWLGYIVFGLLSLVVCVPLFCFPRKLPRNKAKNTRVDEDKMTRNANLEILSHLHAATKQTNEEKGSGIHIESMSRGIRFKFVSKHIREFFASLYRLFTNPVYVVMVISTCCQVFTGAGNSAFFPKYVEQVFHLPVHTANYITDGVC